MVDVAGIAILRLDNTGAILTEDIIMGDTMVDMGDITLGMEGAMDSIPMMECP